MDPFSLLTIPFSTVGMNGFLFVTIDLSLTSPQGERF